MCGFKEAVHLYYHLEVNVQKLNNNNDCSKLGTGTHTTQKIPFGLAMRVEILWM